MQVDIGTIEQGVGPTDSELSSISIPHRDSQIGIPIEWLELSGLTVKNVLAPNHLAGVPTALNQNIVNVQKPHVLSPSSASLSIWTRRSSVTIVPTMWYH